MYLLTANDTVGKFPYSLEELRTDNPYTSFPHPISEEELAAWGVYEVEDQSPPAFNEQTESIEIEAPALVDGKWIRAWSVVAAGPEEVERRYIAKAGLIRTERNKLLAATDYSQLPDYPGSSADKAALTQFRQALREVPQQSGFPWAVVWPMPDSGL